MLASTTPSHASKNRASLCSRSLPKHADQKEQDQLLSAGHSRTTNSKRRERGLPPPTLLSAHIKLVQGYMQNVLAAVLGILSPTLFLPFAAISRTNNDPRPPTGFMFHCIWFRSCRIGICLVKRKPQPNFTMLNHCSNLACHFVGQNPQRERAEAGETREF